MDAATDAPKAGTTTKPAFRGGTRAETARGACAGENTAAPFLPLGGGLPTRRTR
jgi:hypothetical protein